MSANQSLQLTLIWNIYILRNKELQQFCTSRQIGMRIMDGIMDEQNAAIYKIDAV